MLNINENFERFHLGKLARLTAFAIFAASIVNLALAEQPRQKTFSACEEASSALFAAVQKDDQSGLLDILGPAATEIISSGDEAEDRSSRQQFVEKYQNYYRILTSQGRHAPGGAKNYLVHGKMTGGFAFVAYPAEYRSSGVMTFIVSQDGIVYQKDLGARTAVQAKSMIEYAPDATWKKVD